MKIIHSRRKHHYTAVISIFLIMLITVALIAGMAGCGQTGTEYTPMIAAGGYHTVGLMSDGTVVAAGLNDDEQCEVGSWRRITQVAAGGTHTVGLRSNGYVVATGERRHRIVEVGAAQEPRRCLDLRALGHLPSDSRCRRNLVA